MRRSGVRDEIPPQQNRYFHADLLTHDGPGEGLPGVGRERNSQASLPLNQGAEQRVGAEACFEFGRLGIEAEDAYEGAAGGGEVGGVGVAEGGRAVEADVEQCGLSCDERALLKAVGSYAFAGFEGIPGVEIAEFVSAVAGREGQFEFVRRRLSHCLSCRLILASSRLSKELSVLVALSLPFHWALSW